MAKLYTKKVWVNDQTKLSARNLNHIENGIEAVADAIDKMGNIGQVILESHSHDNKQILDQIDTPFTSEVANTIAGKSTVSVSAEGTATELAKYITINGVEYKLAGIDESEIPEVSDEIPYQELNSAALDELIAKGVYVIKNASDAPNGTAASGILHVNTLTNGKVEQEWLSDTNRAIRILDTESIVTSNFYVDGVKTEPIDGVVELNSGATYTLSGELIGKVSIIGSIAKYTTLKLNNVIINSVGSAGIINTLDNRLSIEILDGTENHVIVSDLETVGDTSSIGAVHSEGDLTILGTGALTVVSTKGHGFKGADISFGGYPKIYIDAHHDGIHGKSVRITEGKYYIKNANDAISGGTSKNNGKILVSGGDITIERCAENAFQAKTKTENVIPTDAGFIQIYGNTSLTFKANFSTKNPFNAENSEAKVFSTVAIHNESDKTMPTLIDLATYYGEGRVTDADNEPMTPSGNVYYLDGHYADGTTGNTTYNLKGDLSNYRFVVTVKSANLNFKGVYCHNTDTEAIEPFIDYTPDGKRVELKIADNSINYIYKAVGACLSSNKNLGINNANDSGDLFLECPGGYGIFAPYGDTRILNDGARYIKNCNVGIYTNYLSLGEDYEDIDPTKKKDSFVYLTGSTVADVELLSRTASEGWKPGKIVAPANNYGITIIDKAVKYADHSTDTMSIEAVEATVSPETTASFTRTSTIYYKQVTNLEIINATSFVNNISSYVLPVEVNTISTVSIWKVYDSHALRAIIEELSGIITNLQERVETLETRVPATTNAELSDDGNLTLDNVIITEDNNLDLSDLAILHDDGSLEL